MPATVHPLELPDGGRCEHIYSADGTRLHAEIFGPDDAPTIVLIHGITMQMRSWAYQVADLEGQFRVVVYDQRGHGRSGKPGPAGYTIAALGDDLQAVLDACLGPGEAAVLAGHSMGGIAIMSWAIRHPSEVSARAAACALL